MRITRVYTRTGDGGTTRLVGGDEVAKDDARVEAFGTVDELNAILGQARCHVLATEHDSVGPVDSLLGTLQNELFDLGAELATPNAAEAPVRIGPSAATRLEKWIDALNDDLEPLREFILPGGGVAATTLHHARTVCRRAERRVVSLGDGARSDQRIYLNRLSDLLFVLARWVAKAQGERETMWENPKHRQT